MSYTTTRRKPRGTIWALIVAVIVALIWAAASFIDLVRQAAPFLHQPGQLSAGYGVVVGDSLFRAGIVWAVMYFAYVRRHTPGRGLIYFVILFAIVAAANVTGISLVKAYGDKSEAQDAIAGREIVGALRTVIHSQDGAVDTRPKATGDAGKVEQITKTLLAQIMTDRHNFSAEVSALDYPHFLSPQQIATDRNLRRARGRLVQLRALVTKYRQLGRQREDEFRARIGQSGVNDSLRRSVLAGFDQSLARSTASADALWNLDDGVFAEYQQAIDVLRRSQGLWFVDGNRYVFQSPADLMAWKGHMDRAHQLVEEQHRLHQDMVSNAEADLKP